MRALPTPHSRTGSSAWSSAIECSMLQVELPRILDGERAIERAGHAVQADVLVVVVNDIKSCSGTREPAEAEIARPVPALRAVLNQRLQEDLRRYGVAHLQADQPLDEA